MSLLLMAGGQKYAQIFIGSMSLLTNIYPLKSISMFPSILSDNIKTTPLQLALSTTNNISHLLYFTFYQPVYYLMDDTPFPSNSHEHHGHWVGVSETIGNFMTFKILTDDMKKIIRCSNIHSACDLSSQNLQIVTQMDHMMNLLRLSSPSTVLLPLCLMGRTLWILRMLWEMMPVIQLTTTPIACL
jgi:hypothetical protein